MLLNLYKYAKYSGKRHPKLIKDENAVAVLRKAESSRSSSSKEAGKYLERRMTIHCRRRDFTDR